MYSSDSTEPTELSPCNHEDGDYRSLLHYVVISKEGVNKAIIFTADNNAVVIAILFFCNLNSD